MGGDGDEGEEEDDQLVVGGVHQKEESLPTCSPCTLLQSFPSQSLRPGCSCPPWSCVPILILIPTPSSCRRPELRPWKAQRWAVAAYLAAWWIMHRPDHQKVILGEGKRERSSEREGGVCRGVTRLPQAAVNF